MLVQVMEADEAHRYKWFLFVPHFRWDDADQRHLKANNRINSVLFLLVPVQEIVHKRALNIFCSNQQVYNQRILDICFVGRLHGYMWQAHPEQRHEYTEALRMRNTLRMALLTFHTQLFEDMKSSKIDHFSRKKDTWTDERNNAVPAKLN